MPGDPLFDTLFRPTVAIPAIASAAPVTTAGTRSRAGNAMIRTRAAILDGARRAVEISGTKITMAQVAAAAGVAKATLYNHFRTRDAVLSALLVDEVTSLVSQIDGQPVAEALTRVAILVSEHPVVRALAYVEPATLATIARIDRDAEGWRLAYEAVDDLLRGSYRGGTDIVLRWLSSHIVSPADRTSVAADVEMLLIALPPALPATSERPTAAAVQVQPVQAQSA